MNDESFDPTEEAPNEVEPTDYLELINFRVVNNELELTFQNHFEIYLAGADEGLPFTAEATYALKPPQMENLLKQLTVWKQAQESNTPDNRKLKEAIRAKMREHIDKANEYSNQLLALS